MAGKPNIVLIGMCGVGKSTVGVLLAKELAMDFVDTDLLIQSAERRSLQEILDDKGIEIFCRLEQDYILALNTENTIIATGGSVVYSDKAMQHLSVSGLVVHLDLDFESVEKRVVNLYSRGVVMHRNETLKSLYEKRLPLYRKYAQVTIDCAAKTQQEIVTQIIDSVSGLLDK